VNRTENRTGASYGVTIPADVEREDRLLAGLTARQLGILAGAALVAWVVGVAVRTVLPVVAALVAAWMVLLVGLGLALGRRDGLSLDRLVLAAWRQRRAPRWMVPAPEGVQPAPRLSPTWTAWSLPRWSCPSWASARTACSILTPKARR